MKSYWLGSDKKNRKFFKDYSKSFNMPIPDNADIIVVAEDDGDFCGFSAIVATPGYADIVFFLVIREKRRNGCGSFMLQEIEKAVRESKIGHLRCMMPSGGERLLGLFTKEGFDLFPGETEYAINFGALYYSEKYLSLIAGKEPKNTKTLSELNTSENGMLKAFFNKQGITAGKHYNKKLSSVTIENGEIVALLLCDGVPTGVIIVFMYVDKDHPDFLLNGFRLIDKSLSGFGEKAKKLKISFSTGNDSDLGLVKKIAEDMVQINEITREVIAIKQCLPESH